METFSLSPGQRALWLVEQLTPRSVAHNVVHGSWILDDVNVSLLRKAFQQVFDRHPCLRSVFRESDGEPVRIEDPAVSLAFECQDVSTYAPDPLQRAIARIVYRPFDITRGPLMRVSLLRRGGREYIILLSFHHLVVDLWSIALMIDESTRFYSALLRGESLLLPAPARTYDEFVRAQNELVAGEKGEELWSFWQKYLAGDLAVLELPTDQPRPRVQEHHGSTETCRLSAGLCASLKDLGRRHGATLFSTVLAAFFALLHRYTGQDDILIGTPKANRQRSMLEVVGYFINPIVLRAKVCADISFSTLLTSVQGSVESAFRHDAFPFGSLVERLQPSRDPGRFPLFQVMFSWQKTVGPLRGQHMTAFALGEDRLDVDVNGLHLASLSMPDLAVPFDLTLMVAEANDGELAMTLEYDTALYTRATARRVLNHMQIILKTVVVSPERPVHSLPLLTQEERQVIGAWSGVPAVAMHHSCAAHDDIDAVARRQPAAVALVDGAETLSYAALMREAEALSRRLRSARAGPMSVVGFYGEQSSAYVISLLGILMSGAAYLPLDPGYPRERLQFMVQDAGARIVLSSPDHALAAGVLGKRVIPVVTGTSHDKARTGSASLPELLEGLPAYVMYTSGSTGRPKGVCIDYAGLTRHCHVAAAHYDLQPDDRVLQFAALSFDPSIEQVLATLLAGATLVIRDGELWPADELHTRIQRHEISVINIPPSYWQEVAAVWSVAPSLLRHTPLRLIIIGGDVLPAEALALWRGGPLRRVRLLNAYGPTETTITALTHDVGAHISKIGEHARVPIGIPLPGRRAFVLDQSGNPVAPGIPGVLHLGGHGLAMGYLNDASLTAERFRPDAWSGHSGARVYDTGDRVRYREDGALEFLGRKDHQVKIRGFRVELDEIAQRARSHPAVSDAIVLHHRAEKGDGLLFLYVTTHDSVVVTRGELREFLRKHLPPHMVPAGVMLMHEFPRTAGGKIDRQALPVPGLDALSAGTPYVKPRTPLEEYVSQEVARLLNVDRVGVHDNFFDLGGHSLLASRLLSTLRHQYRVDLSLRELFEAPTVGDLATTISRSVAGHQRPDVVNRALSVLTAMSDEEARAMLEAHSRRIDEHG
jgi:amino acid adenylation domain-containing protein